MEHEAERVTSRFVDVGARIYHGLIEPDEDGGNPIAVEEGGGGPTERKLATRLGYLTTPARHHRDRSFWWGSTSQSAQYAGEALLTDALEEKPREHLEMDFVEDIVSHLPNHAEWWLPRRAILRWVLGYCAEHDILPPAAAQHP